MYIISLEKINLKKYLLVLDDGRYFPVYNQSVRRYDLEEGRELPDDICEKLYKDALTYAKRRTLYLLKDMDRSVNNIKDKLRSDRYCDDIIIAAIAYLEEHNYVDDHDYAYRFIESKCGELSRLMIVKKLMQRGIEKNLVTEILDELEYDEEKALDYMIEKKNYGDLTDDKDKEKAIRYLISQGFSYGEVCDRFR